MKKDLTGLMISIGLINLCLVALIGVIMRYKIGFEFPYFNQKYLLHAHSHFAFAGWVSHMLFTLMVRFLLDRGVQTSRYFSLLVVNLICAFGMLFSFTVQGYSAVSITFSSISILNGFVFALYFFADLTRNCPRHPSTSWFKAALVFNILSAVGTMYLAYMMASGNIDQKLYLASIYFYLHFQYSGWFFFAIMGLFMASLASIDTFRKDVVIFSVFFIACIPAYFLSILWANLPWYIFLLPLLAVILQLVGITRFLMLLFRLKPEIAKNWVLPARWVLSLSLLALIIKLVLQTGSILPEVSKLAFGFRSIVIAYLHLVLLGFTTMFILGYLLLERHISIGRTALWAVGVFCAGVGANELVLMVQGIASFGYVVIPYLNQILFLISMVMMLSVVVLVISHAKDRNKASL